MNKILIIEDDFTLRENLTEFLTEEGFNVNSADNGVTGIQMAISQMPDIILCDIMLPGMNGLEILKTVQQIKTTSPIPLIFISAKSEKEDIRSGMQLGADDYITKPFDLYELLQTIRIRLEKNERIKKIYDEKFYALIDNPLMGVFIYVDDKFEYVNAKFASLFGLEIKEFTSKSFKDLIASESANQIMEKIRKGLKGILENVQVQFDAVNMKNSQKKLIGLYANKIDYKGISALVGNTIEIEEKEIKNDFFIKMENPDNLSKRELEILRLVCKGLSTSEIAESNFISTRTVDAHRANILNKTGNRNTAELFMYALKKRIVTID